jgi:hypothetical protein
MQNMHNMQNMQNMQNMHNIIDKLDQYYDRQFDELLGELMRSQYDQAIYIEILSNQHTENIEKKQSRYSSQSSEKIKKIKNTYNVRPIKGVDIYKVPKSEQYVKNGYKLWKFKYTDTVRTVEYTDIPCNIEHATALHLKHIARLLGLSNYNSLTKRELISQISPRLIFE